jgi:AraC-like DNA-binding protein
MIRGHGWHGSSGLEPPIDVLLDLSGLEAISAPLFALYVREMVPKVGFFARFIRRQAIVVPTGLVGTIVAGFYPMLEGRTPRYRMFREPGAALAWLGKRDALGEVDRVVREHRAHPHEVAALRELLMACRCAIGLEEAAARLCISSRPLQRTLAEAHTSFRIEHQRARLQLAYDALGSTEAKLEAVAEHVGLTNASHFCAWFRESTGMTPAQWRSNVTT